MKAMKGAKKTRKLRVMRKEEDQAENMKNDFIFGMV